MKRTPTIYLILYTLVLATLTCCTANRLPSHSSSGGSSSDLTSDLFDAICNNDTASVANLLGQDGSLLNKIVSRDDQGVTKKRTPLMYAAQLEDQTMVSLLIGQGADVNKANNNGTTPLHIAAQKGRLDLVKCLVQAGADVNKVDSDDNTPFSIATQNQVKNYLQGYSRAAKKLGEAIKDGNLRWVQKTISDCPDINLNGKITVEKDNGGNAYLTPLQIGAAWGKYDIVKCLLDNHRDRLYMDAKTEVGGSTALHLAAKKGHERVVDILIQNGASKDIQDTIGTPLHRAVISESKRVVGCLIEKGVDITLKNRDSKTALELAREKDHKKIINLIENYEIESELRNYVSEDSENFEHIKNAFEKSSYQASNPVMDSPSLLYHAAKKGWKEAVKFLVEKGEEEDLRELIRQKDDSCHLSPLYVAVQEENTEMVELLIYGRAKSNHKNLANGYERIEQEAVQGRGAAVADLRDQEGRTLLHVAAVKGHESIVKLLVEFMAIAAEQYENERRDPNDQVHQSDVMRELMYVSRKDSTDNTAESLAHSAEFTPIVDFLKEVKEGIEERRKNLDNNAKVLSTCGGGINTGILGCIGSLVSCIHGSLGVLGIQCNGAYQTQSWVHERKRLIIEARKIWRDKNNRLWQD